ncbi:MAG: DinB family protein [Vicinamibacterales bacterium]
MPTIDQLLAELEHEAATTRRVLERIPEGRLDWRPHPKSMSLGQLGLHIATLPGFVAAMSRQSPFQVPEFTQPAPTTAGELVPMLDASIAEARRVLSGLTETDLAETWKLVKGEHEIFAVPVGMLLRNLMLNHWYHHRGQLSVYLRELEVPVPSIYGPSADENPFASAMAAGG